MTKFRFVWIVLIGIILAGCEKKVDFKLQDAEPKLVVDASIENGQPPQVTLTRSLDYFSTFTPELLAQSFVHGADVFVSNGTLTHRLKEYTVPLGPGVNLYYYSIDSASLATAFEGEIKKSYSLKIISDGKEFTASTTIPDTTRRIDSIWWKPTPSSNSNDTNKVAVIVRATDPLGYGDYIRYYTKNQKTTGVLSSYEFGL